MSAKVVRALATKTISKFLRNVTKKAVQSIFHKTELYVFSAI